VRSHLLCENTVSAETESKIFAAMVASTGLFSLLLTASVSAQHIGNYEKEVHLPLSIQSCAATSSCTNLSTSLTVDANWRWLHNKDNSQNCHDTNWWNTTICPDNKSCAANCALEGASYKSVYGVTTTAAGALNMKLVTRYDFSQNVGSRLYLMGSDTKYQVFKLLNKEFSFEVDVSKLPCGANAAMYFVEMDEDGGIKKYPSNKAGAQYGTGYCSAKCPRDLRFINGEVGTSMFLDERHSIGDIAR
jgi:cellulose 1,4-beta-cellobiosidase